MPWYQTIQLLSYNKHTCKRVLVHYAFGNDCRLHKPLSVSASRAHERHKPVLCDEYDDLRVRYIVCNADTFWLYGDKTRPNGLFDPANYLQIRYNSGIIEVL